jgi:hypothetical protein
MKTAVNDDFPVPIAAFSINVKGNIEGKSGNTSRRKKTHDAKNRTHKVLTYKYSIK